MPEQATVTAAEIARLAGVGRAAVSNWRRRYADFPQPVGGPPNSPAFDLVQVESWLRTQGKLGSVPAEDRVWHQLDAVPELSLPDAVVLVGAFLLHLDQRGGKDWPALSAKPDRTVANRLTAPLRRLVQDLPGSRTMPEPLTAQHVALLRAVADTADERGAAATFDYFLDRYQDAVSRREFVTPAGLAALMVSLAGTTRGTVLDPACGTGTLLAAAARRAPDAEVLGQDVNPESAALAAIRLTLTGTRARVLDGDTLLDDAYPDLAADAVLCDPPFAVRNWGYEELTYDARWEYGTPPRAESELAWVQHCLAHARPDGTVVVVMPATAASRASGRRLRAQLLRRGALRAVIGLPAGTLGYTAIPVHLWVLRRPGGDDSPGRLLLVDATGGQAAGQDGGRSRAVDWERIGGVVLDAWRRFLKEPESVDEPGVAGAVPLIDLLDEEVDLTPSRRLVPVATETVGPRFDEVSGTLARLLSEVPGLLPELTAAEPTETRPTSSVSELAKLGALSLHSGTTRRIGGSGDVTDGVPVLTTQDVITGRAPSGAISREEVDSTVQIAPGDVVVPIVARSIVPTVVTEGGAVLGPHLYLVHPDPQVLDPWFLAGFLRTPENVRHAGSLGSVNRIDIRRARVPRLPLAEQQRYGELFRRLAALERSLGQAADLGRELGRIAVEGLAAGVLRPAP